LKQKIIGSTRSNCEDEIKVEMMKWVLNEEPDIKCGVDLEVEITIKTKKITKSKKKKVTQKTEPVQKDSTNERAKEEKSEAKHAISPVKRVRGKKVKINI